MKNFARLFTELDLTNKTNRKITLLKEYFETADPSDKLWTLALFTGKRPKRQVTITQLREWATEVAGIPDWLFSECYHVVGDLAETISLLLPGKSEIAIEKSLTNWIDFQAGLKDLPPEEKKLQIQRAWTQLDKKEIFVFLKILTGAFRVGVSSRIVIKALSLAENMDEAELTHKLTGKWHPSKISFTGLVHREEGKFELSKPYPFFLAYQIDEEVSHLGPPGEWHAEWKWDGIRGQLILREGNLFVWSRGEDLVTEAFPEFQILRESLPGDLVLDGEIIPYIEKPLSFNILQKRLGRKKIGQKLLKEAPVAFMAYDLLELEKRDLRAEPFNKRRALLEKVVADTDKPNILLFSREVAFENWTQLQEIRKLSREKFAEGLMLKQVESPYLQGRKKGFWWKWKVDPLTIDAVLIYAQRGHGRRANLYTDYSFAVWKGERLVPFAKAYSGLTDEEIMEVNNYIKLNTLDRFGPVRTVKPELVFEIAFEGIRRSARHKSGIAVRFPRIKRWRKDKIAAEADTLDNLEKILENYEG